jgi:hypothetical protein
MKAEYLNETIDIDEFDGENTEYVEKYDVAEVDSDCARID